MTEFGLRPRHKIEVTVVEPDTNRRVWHEAPAQIEVAVIEPDTSDRVWHEAPAQD